MPASKNTATIRVVRPQDWRIVRDVTLKLLADSPHAFGETLAEAEARSTADWQAWTQQLADPTRGCGYLAEDGFGACGFVRGDMTMPQLPPGAALAGQLWVAPRQRGTGLGRLLMDAVTNWATTRGAEQIVLGITETNLNVVKFYEHLGYSDTGMRVPIPGHLPRHIIVMARRLKA